MQVYSWFEDSGNPFITSSNTIGASQEEADSLLQAHKDFETRANHTYSLTQRLVAEAKSLSSSKDCDPVLIGTEEESLKSAEVTFTSHMTQRQAILELASEFFQKMSQVCLK